METYRGCIETTDDALLIFEACRLGMLQRVSRRLVEDERNCIQSGSVYVWDESESGIRRWTDGKRWSPSRVNGCFLIYTELEPKTSTSSPSSRPGLVKKALSLFTAHASKLHLVCYYNKEDLNSGKLMTPSQDPLLCKLPIPRSLYPDVIPELIHVASSHSISGYPAHGNSSHGRSSAFSSYPVVQSSSVSSAQRCSGQSRTSGMRITQIQ
ncbi:Gluconate transport-inducing protein [Linderina macrospora]|uniref:Gluconate transport-inducing protein n=1 Tax=Linderina macrospora TaxID=4868 RepID=A0ACC1J185_9FUNG|nr:Gluconate transport-inducing protein [Linderina macrospora]